MRVVAYKPLMRMLDVQYVNNIATIRKNRSGESLSTTFFIYAGCYFFMFMVYGITKHSIAMAFNGFIGIPYAFILVSLYRFKGFTRKDWIFLALFSLMTPTVYLLNAKARDIFTLIGLFGILVPLTGQVREMYRTKIPGSVEPKFIFTFMLSNVFWFIYGITTNNWIFVVFNPISLALLTTALVLYLKYKKRAALS